MTAADNPHVLVCTEGRAGFLTLNRPKAINALTHAMVRRVDEALTAWEDDPAIETVVIQGAGERGCAPAATSGRSTTTPAPAAAPPSTSGATSTGSTPASPAIPSPTSPSWTA